MGYFNLVFQGGGTKGLAYAGAMDAIPAECTVHSVAGTSAGAIAASLVAIGKRQELRRLLSPKVIYDLLEPEDIQLLGDLAEAFQKASEIGTNIGYKTPIALSHFLWSRRDLLRRTRIAVARRGVHRTRRLHEWLNTVLEGKTFNDLVVDDLLIVSADLAGQRYRVFSKKTDLSRPLAQAVLASASIPLFFEPAIVDGTPFVDGGMLSNYPAYLFAAAEFPTIGFRLVDVEAPASLETTFDFFKALLLTATTAHDKTRPRPPKYTQVDIPIRPGFRGTSFLVQPEDAAALYQAGLAAARSVPWDRVALDRAENYLETRPADALNLALAQARRLFDLYGLEALWAEQLHYDMDFSVRIESDWSTFYVTKSRVKVRGAKPLMLTRSFFESADGSFANRSLADFENDCVETTGGESRALIRIPAINNAREKGFVQFYTPPIVEADPERSFEAHYRLPQEFRETLGKGRPDVVGKQIRQMAAEHTFTLRFRILAHSSLPPIRVEGDFGAIFGPPADTSQDDLPKAYSVHECELGSRSVSGDAQFMARLSMSD